MGNNRSAVNRPVIGKFRNVDAATEVLRKSQCLKNSGKFNKVVTQIADEGAGG